MFAELRTACRITLCPLAAEQGELVAFSDKYDRQ